jgi:general stress protein 26
MDSSLDYKKLAFDFLQSHTVAILSTVSPDNLPDAAVIYTLVDEQFNFFFITKSATTKAKNLENNKNAALTLGDRQFF